MSIIRKPQGTDISEDYKPEHQLEIISLNTDL